MKTILAKIGIKDVISNFATFVRIGVVIICSVVLCIITGDISKTNEMKLNNWILILSGIVTGGAWLCEYSALNYDSSNRIVVNSIRKLSILLTMLLSFIIMEERFSKKSLLGLLLLSVGIILIIVFSL